MQKSKIEWCDVTVNAVRGCTYGCTFCYARRLNGRHLPGYIPDFSKPQFFPERLDALECKKPKVIFMDSMSDIADWKPEWTKEIFETCLAYPQHKYLFLSKRLCDFYENIDADLMLKITEHDNIMFGHSITKQSMFKELNEYGYIANFLSIEPILEPINLENEGLGKYVKWVIVGAQTGPNSKKHQPHREWIENIANQCKENDVPLFMKNSLADIWDKPLIQEFPW